jgi:hypothetical protein
MQKHYSSKLLQLFGVKSSAVQVAAPEAPASSSAPAGSLGVDQLGVPVENPLRSYAGHCLILGATGTGKTTLLKNLVADLDCRIVLLSTTSTELPTLIETINLQKRFEFPVLLVVDDIHLFAEHLEVLELLARDGKKSNVLILITAQLLDDLPEAVWRNCQIRFAIGLDARRQLNLEANDQLGAYVAVFSWPGRQGFMKVAEAISQRSALPTQSNPLLRRASTLPSAPYEESVLARQTPLDQWSMEGQAELQDLHDRQLDSTGQPRRTRYSRTL